MNIGGNLDANVNLQPVKVEVSVSAETLAMIGVIALLATVYGIKRIKG